MMSELGGAGDQRPFMPLSLACKYVGSGSTMPLTNKMKFCVQSRLLRLLAASQSGKKRRICNEE
eukprot:scaffold38615_cov155-Skeletonema_dohrnii-CCMP3373.AAC.5